MVWSIQLYHVFTCEWKPEDFTVETRICLVGHASSSKDKNSVEANLTKRKKIKTKTSDRYTSQSELAFQIVSIERGRKEWVRNHRNRQAEENLIWRSECWLIYNPFGYPWCVDSISASSQKPKEKQKAKKVLVSRKRKSCNCIEQTKVCLKKRGKSLSIIPEKTAEHIKVSFLKRHCGNTCYQKSCQCWKLPKGR